MTQVVLEIHRVGALHFTRLPHVPSSALMNALLCDPAIASVDIKGTKLKVQVGEGLNGPVWGYVPQYYLEVTAADGDNDITWEIFRHFRESHIV